MTNETEKLIKDALELCGTRYELEAGYKHRLLSELAHALRRAETERDAQARELARFKAVAALANSVVRWDSLLNEMHEQKARAQRAEQERDAQAALVATRTAERDSVSVVHACPPKGSGVMPCCGATPFEKQGERLTADPALVNCDRQRLIAENARLQKEHNAYVQRLSADALQVASKYQRERDAAQSMEADTARRSSAEIDGLKAELNEARGEIEDLNRRVAELHGQREEARKERDVLQWVKTASVRLLDALSRIQWMEPHEPEDEKAAKAVRDWLSVSGLLVHAELLEDIKDLRAQIATLELLRRGGK